MQVLTGIRRGKVWVVTHATDDEVVVPGPATAETVEISPVSSAGFDPSERPTERAIPAQTIVWSPEQPPGEQWCVFDLLHKGRAPIAKCSALREAERLARAMVRRAV